MRREGQRTAGSGIPPVEGAREKDTPPHYKSEGKFEARGMLGGAEGQEVEATRGEWNLDLG